ncbi:ParB/RepB/Spo0J family partition protein [Angustibacter luteus]|uniref:ParB/RepB/Spo0J family partition protein n=1 Tax=Angustibacter luteus TaxID=658456 RepID=A0ABW1JIF5_9ACTN
MTAPTLELVSPGKIKPHGDNVRTELGDLTELADSIREQGILEPLVVAPTSLAKTPYLLIAGHRRLAAAKLAGLKQIPVVVRADLDDLPKQLEAMLIENGHRADLSPVDEADAYQQLLTFPGYTQKIVAKATGRAATYVRDRLKLTKLGDKARHSVADGQIAIADAIALSEFVDDVEVYDRLERWIGDSRFAWEVTAAKRRRDEAKAAAKATAALEADGVRVIERPEGYPYTRQDVVAPLRSERNVHYSLGIDPAEHIDCPGHAALLLADSTVEYVCTEASLQHRQTTIDDQAPAPSFPDRTPEQVEREAAADQWREDAATAAALRDAFLTPFVTGTQKLTADQAAEVCRVHLQLHLNSELFIDSRWLAQVALLRDWELAEVAADEAGDDRPEMDDWLQVQLIDSTRPIGIALGSCAAQIATDVQSRSGRWDVYNAARISAWYGLLTALGYEPSEWETTQLTALADEIQARLPAPVEDVVESL